MAKGSCIVVVLALALPLIAAFIAAPVALGVEPAAPTLDFASAGDGVVVLCFQPLEGPDALWSSIQVFRSTTAGAYGGPIDELSGDSTSYSDSSVTNGQTYYYRIRANHSGELSPFSIEVSATPSASGRAPSAPIELVGSNGGVCAALTWATPADPGSSPITGYDVYRAETPNVMLSELVLALPWDARTANISVDHYGKDAFYFVKAQNPYGESSAAGPRLVNVSMGGETPSAPRSLQAVGGDWFIYLTWDRPASSGTFIVRDYLIYQRAPGTQWNLIASVPAGVHSYRDDSAGLARGIDFQYMVKAESLSGIGLGSETVTCALSTTNHPPSPPVNVAIAYTSPYSVNISWSPPLDNGGGYILAYKVWCQVDGADGPQYLVNGPECFFVDQSVEPGHNYTYRVAALTIFAVEWDLSWSLAVDTCTNGAGQVPSEPVALLSDNKVRDIISLTWVRPANPSSGGVVGYELARSGSETMADQTLIPVTGEYYEDRDVIPGNAYWYRVRALGAGGSGPWSPTIHTVCSPSPTIPTSLSAFPGDGCVLLRWAPQEKWNEYSDETSYAVYRTTEANGTMVQIAVVGPSVFEFKDNDVANGMTYRYLVSSLRWDLESNVTLPVSVTPSSAGPSPSAPSILASPSRGGIEVHLSPMDEFAGNGLTAYEIWIGRPGGAMRLWDSYAPSYWPPPGDISYEFRLEKCTPAQIGMLYELGLGGMVFAFKAKAVGLHGTSGFSNECVAFLGDYVGEGFEGVRCSVKGTPEGIEVSWSAPTYAGTADFLAVSIWRCAWNMDFDPFGYDWIASLAVNASQGGRYVDSAPQGSTYHYVLFIRSPIGQWIRSDVLTATSMLGSVSAPRNLTAAVSGSSITLQWQEPDGGGVSGYQIYRGVSGGDMALIAEVGADARSYVDPGLTPSSYNYMVVANGTGGVSSSYALTGASVATSGGGEVLIIAVIVIIAIAAVIIALLWRKRSH
jgi:fibronectin type 3 domain-containing protein